MGLTFDYLGIVAESIPESVRFYSELGVVVELPEPCEDHVETVLPNGMRLAWDSLELIKQIDPSWEAPKGQRIGIGFLCDTPDEVDSAYQRVVAAGFKGKMEPWDAFWGQRYATVLDPDGNEVSLFAWTGQEIA